ncbi:hypothetical protein HK414_09825 [Ramlibacter terrae]|uniref:Uncharacterized protein n=1 Tax=Ramlibacter terrae TaxID=2732511 RepID=A0ABX6P3Y9_9BURK|nr:hypothetical protein HK414_09825 [Ramlibacter terrae]
MVDGARQIYEQDIQRRTYGDPARFADETGRSLSASPLAVLKIYTLEWPDKRQMILPGKLFPALLVFAVAGLAVRLWRRDGRARGTSRCSSRSSRSLCRGSSRPRDTPSPRPTSTSCCGIWDSCLH